MKWKWFYEAEFEAPDGRIFLVESVEGFDTQHTAEVYLRQACEEGHLCAQGVPVGSVLVGVEYALKEVRHAGSDRIH